MAGSEESKQEDKSIRSALFSNNDEEVDLKMALFSNRRVPDETTEGFAMCRWSVRCLDRVMRKLVFCPSGFM